MSEQNDDATYIKGLFTELVDDLEYDFTTPLEWVFTLRSPDVELLNAIADELGDDYDIDLIEEAEQVTEEGEVVTGDPVLSIKQTAIFTADEIIALNQIMSDLADQHESLDYLGVICNVGFDDDSVQWMSLDEACEELDALTEAGMEPNPEFPFAFLVTMPSAEILQDTQVQMEAAGYNNVMVFDEPDEEGLVAICFFVTADGNTDVLKSQYEKIDAIVQPIGGEIQGVQFYSDDAFDEVDEFIGSDESEFEDDEFDDEDDDLNAESTPKL